MAKKAFEIQGSDLSLGGVSLQAGTTGVVIPGVTQAVNYFVEEVNDQDGSNSDTFGSDENSVTVIDNAEYLYRSGAETASNSYSAAGYSVDELDDGEIEDINIELTGIFLDSDRQLALRDNMWATTVADPYTSFDANDWTQIPFKPKFRAGEVENIGGGTGGEGLPTITVPAETGTDYKGLQVSYGMVHSNGSSDELNVNKIVIHKPAVTTTTIHPTSSDDDFQVSGLGTSDVLAMFVFYGDVNGAKPLSDLQAFAESAIDNVILIDGEEGEFRTVDAMKAAFYDNYPSLAQAANGLYTDFKFFGNASTLNGGVTTVREGYDALFDIIDNGNGTYSASILNGGIDYLVGHKIKILGTDLGGATPDNDIIIRVEALTSSSISSISNTGTAAGTAPATYNSFAGANYEVGSGFTVDLIYASNNFVQVNSYGTNYVVGDVITLPGANITNGTTPDNNFTITVAQVDGSGQAYDYTSTGTIPEVWRTNSIDDGGEDQYDNGNFINTNLAEEIDYNDGETVVDGTAAFGTGSTYSFVYDTAIFGLFVRGSTATLLSTSGGSGADGSSVTVAGNIYGPSTVEQTFNNAVSFINLVGTPYAGPLITFTRTDYGDEVDEISEGLHITKDNQGWLYNALEDDGHSDNTPTGSVWNNDGWDDFTNVESRIYTSLSDIWNGNFASIPGAKMVMLDETTGKYWAIEFLSWTNNNQGGGASYTRQELDLDSLETGIRFQDGTRQTTAYVDTNVKLTAPGSRRIEEVYGYKQVSVTSRTTSNTVTTTAFSNNSNDTRYVSLSASGAARDALIALSNGSVYYRVQVSLNQTDWATGSVNGWGNDDVVIYFDDGARLAVAQGDTVYYRTYTGSESVTWWDKDDLPGGSSNFRGAVIDYHAYTGDATIIGTIHIVDDDGEENITHTEVSSGSTDSENDDLWYVTTEGRIRYRRLDGESATLKIQWTAKVFYGSETND
jgi:hypothetical protein